MKALKFLLIFLSISLTAQSKIDESQWKVFEPDEHSVLYNEIYTRDFFFGNFGLKQLAAGLPISNQDVKTILITAEKGALKNQKVMELQYSANGQLTQMKIFEDFFGKPMSIEYKYKDQLIEEEIITQNKEKKSNRFFYKDGKMVVLNTKGLLDIYSMNQKVLTKQTYMKGELVLNDRMDGKCRITTYNKKAINKVCFSDLNAKLPFVIDEYTQNENATGKLVLEKDQSLRLEQVSEREYKILANELHLYTLKLDQNNRVSEFDFLGIKREQIAPVSFKFNYTNHLK